MHALLNEFIMTKFSLARLGHLFCGAISLHQLAWLINLVKQIVKITPRQNTVAAPLIAAASNRKIFSGQLGTASIQERPLIKK